VKKILFVLFLLAGIKLAYADVAKGYEAMQAGDYETALSEFKSAEGDEQGSAYYYLGVMYENGTGVNVNLARAWDWYNKSAELGNVDSKQKLAEMYETGHGVKINYVNSLKYYKDIADSSNSTNAIYKTSQYYVDGRIGYVDIAEAEKYALKLQTAGDHRADTILKKIVELKDVYEQKDVLINNNALDERIPEIKNNLEKVAKLFIPAFNNNKYELPKDIIVNRKSASVYSFVYPQIKVTVEDKNKKKAFFTLVNVTGGLELAKDGTDVIYNITLAMPSNVVVTNEADDVVSNIQTSNSKGMLVWNATKEKTVKASSSVDYVEVLFDGGNPVISTKKVYANHVDSSKEYKQDLSIDNVKYEEAGVGELFSIEKIKYDVSGDSSVDKETVIKLLEETKKKSANKEYFVPELVKLLDAFPSMNMQITFDGIKLNKEKSKGDIFDVKQLKFRNAFVNNHKDKLNDLHLEMLIDGVNGKEIKNRALMLDLSIEKLPLAQIISDVMPEKKAVNVSPNKPGQPDELVKEEAGAEGEQIVAEEAIDSENKIEASPAVSPLASGAQIFASAIGSIWKNLHEAGAALKINDAGYMDDVSGIRLKGVVHVADNNKVYGKGTVNIKNFDFIMQKMMEESKKKAELMAKQQAEAQKQNPNGAVTSDVQTDKTDIMKSMFVFSLLPHRATAKKSSDANNILSESFDIEMKKDGKFYINGVEVMQNKTAGDANSAQSQP